MLTSQFTVLTPCGARWKLGHNWSSFSSVDLRWVGRALNTLTTQLNSTENVQNCNNSQSSWVELSQVVKSIRSARPDSTQPVELSWVELGRALWTGLKLQKIPWVMAPGLIQFYSVFILDETSDIRLLMCWAVSSYVLPTDGSPRKLIP